MISKNEIERLGSSWRGSDMKRKSAGINGRHISHKRTGRKEEFKMAGRPKGNKK